MLQPTFSSSVKSSAKIINRVFYLPYPDLVLVPNIVTVLKASIGGTNSQNGKTLRCNYNSLFINLRDSYPVSVIH